MSLPRVVDRVPTPPPFFFGAACLIAHGHRPCPWSRALAAGRCPAPSPNRAHHRPCLARRANKPLSWPPRLQEDMYPVHATRANVPLLLAAWHGGSWPAHSAVETQSLVQCVRAVHVRARTNPASVSHGCMGTHLSAHATAGPACSVFGYGLGLRTTVEPLEPGRRRPAIVPTPAAPVVGARQVGVQPRSNTPSSCHSTKPNSSSD